MFDEFQILLQSAIKTHEGLLLIYLLKRSLYPFRRAEGKLSFHLEKIFVPMTGMDTGSLCIRKELNVGAVPIFNKYNVRTKED